MPAYTKLESRFTEIIAELQPLTREGCKQVCDEVVEGAKARCPVGDEPPHLRDRIHTEAGEKGYFVVAGDSQVFYGHMVEFGTSHSAAQPFLIPALESVAAERIAASAVAKVSTR
jgi:HK97 gp10 family phage protein